MNGYGNPPIRCLVQSSSFDHATEKLIRQTLAQAPLAESGTMTAVYALDSPGRETLLKLFARNWSSHTRDFWQWAYGPPPVPHDVAIDLANSFAKCQDKLRSYGLNTVEPWALWLVNDPYTASEPSECALALLVPRLADKTVHEALISIHSDSERVIELYIQHADHIIGVINKAFEHNDVDGHYVRYGFDPKPRNFLYDGRWTYIDEFPILDPFVLQKLCAHAPIKPLRKRFDVRYYLYDLVTRYYRVCPTLFDRFRHLMIDRLEQQFGGNSEFTSFVDDSLLQYRAKWGHMTPTFE